MHGVYKRDPLGNAAFLQTLLDLRRDVDKAPARRDIEPQLFSVRFYFVPSEGAVLPRLFGQYTPANYGLRRLFCEVASADTVLFG